MTQDQQLFACLRRLRSDLLQAQVTLQDALDEVERVRGILAEGDVPAPVLRRAPDGSWTWEPIKNADGGFTDNAGGS